MDPKRFAAAALAAIQEHVSRGIGTRPMPQWTDHDVTDTGILCRALSEQGLLNDDSHAEKLEDVVSPLVFWRYHCETVEEAMLDPAIQNALMTLAAVGVTYALPAIVSGHEVAPTQ